MKYFYSLLMLFISVTITIQSQTITGYVCTKKDKSPVEFATVTLLNLPDSAIISGVTTHKNGSYVFPAVIPGKYFIRVSLLGYSNSGHQISIV
jgi:hypothetical protein